MASRVVILLVALFGVSLAQNQPWLQACDTVQLQTCQGQFNTKLGVDSSLGVTSFQALRTAVEQTFANGQAYGLLTTCEAYKEYQQCYTDTNFYSCAQNPFGLLAANGTTKFSRVQAYGYQKIWNQLDFVCGAGFGLFANNENCGSSVFANNATALRQCDTDFETNVVLDQSQTCAYVELAATCYQRIFYDACRRSEMGWWGCNYERTGTNLNYPQCTQLFCSFHS